MWKSALVFLAVVGVSLAGLASGKLPPKPDKFKDVEGCYIEELDDVIPFGESKPSKKGCMEYRCSSNYITYVTCGVADAQPPCKVVTDSKKPYPECCPKISCP